MHRCEDACEEHALFFVGLMNPRVLTDRCTLCADCVPVCPTAAITVRDTEKIPINGPERTHEISSIVIKTLPENLEAVKASLAKAGLCDIHFSDDLGRIIITVEGDGNEDETMKLKAIQKLPQVVSADFSYTYADEDPE